MILRTKGDSKGLVRPLVARVTRVHSSLSLESVFLLENDLTDPHLKGHLAVLSTLSPFQTVAEARGVYEIPSLSHLSEGDVVCIEPDGNVQTLYRVNSRHNFLLVTERCNSNCLMCSQPPRDRDDVEYLFGIHRQLIPLIPKTCEVLGITGGEPTLLGEAFIELLSLIKQHLPETDLQVLTNGRAFCDEDFAERIAALDYGRLILCIPLYADNYELHDYVVQARGAFHQTVLGLNNLARFDQRIEIRVVLHRLTIPRLVKLAEFIYRNLPFVEHVAFMGLENQGYTPHNLDRLWIDPYDYQAELEEAVEYLDSFGVNPSIYNLQLCVLPRKLWRFSRKSISDWKNIYLDECEGCSVRGDCGGFFASMKNIHSLYIKPVQPVPADPLPK